MRFADTKRTALDRLTHAGLSGAARKMDDPEQGETTNHRPMTGPKAVRMLWVPRCWTANRATREFHT